ncbi:MAG: hypothetical protein ACP5I8_01805 [Phycisphaerae bacterium]
MIRDDAASSIGIFLNAASESFVATYLLLGLKATNTIDLYGFFIITSMSAFRAVVMAGCQAGSGWSKNSGGLTIDARF